MILFNKFIYFIFKDIDKSISTELTNFFSTNGAIFVSFQLLEINIPKNFNDILIKTEVNN